MEILITKDSLQTIKAEMIEQNHKVQPHFYIFLHVSCSISNIKSIALQR